MSEKAKKHPNVCRLTVVKIVDSGPIPSNDTDYDDANTYDEPVPAQEPTVRRSPHQKRPISPTVAPTVASKKPRLEQSAAKVQKKPAPSMVKSEHAEKASVTIKKPKLVTCKASSVGNEKVSKSVVIKETNPAISTNENVKSSIAAKPRLSVKLVKSQSLNDVKSLSSTAVVQTKKKEAAVLPMKPKIVPNAQTTPKKPTVKNPPKTAVKVEHAAGTVVKPPLTVVIKHESPATASTSMSNLKKIPKKPAPAPSSKVEQRSRSSVPSSSADRSSTKEPMPVKSKTTPMQRDPSSSKANNRPEKKQIIEEDTVRNAVRSERLSGEPSESVRASSSSPQKSSATERKPLKAPAPPPPPPPPPPAPVDLMGTPSPAHNEPSVSSVVSASSIDASHSSNLSSPVTHAVHNDYELMLSPVDTDTQSMDKPYSREPIPHEESAESTITFSEPAEEPESVQATNAPVPQMFYSDQFDLSEDDDDDDDDDNGSSSDDPNHDDDELPSSLTDDDLRYKLIYIYNRFQLNCSKDLNIFVRFFKRHQLIDTSALSAAKTSDGMFTYDLFSLSASHIGELASDLGYALPTAADATGH